MRSWSEKWCSGFYAPQFPWQVQYSLIEWSCSHSRESFWHSSGSRSPFHMFKSLGWYTCWYWLNLDLWRCFLGRIRASKLSSMSYLLLLPWKRPLPRPPSLWCRWTFSRFFRTCRIWMCSNDRCLHFRHGHISNANDKASSTYLQQHKTYLSTSPAPSPFSAYHPTDSIISFDILWGDRRTNQL